MARAKKEVKKKESKIKNKKKKAKDPKNRDAGERKISKRVIAIIVAAALFILSFFIIRPFIAALLSGIILAYLLAVPYKKLNKLIKRPTISAAIICILTILILALAVYFIAQITIREAFNLYMSIQKLDIFNVIYSFLVRVFPGSPELTRQITITLQQSLTTLTNAFVNKIGTILTNAPAIFIQFFIAFFVMFYFLREGDRTVTYIKEVLPFSPAINKQFIKKSQELTGATIYGQIAVGVLQGAVAGIGFYVFRAPSPLFFTLLSVFCGILPFVGPWLVFVPVGAIMMAAGNYLNGLLLIAFGTVIIGFIGTIGRSIIVAKKGRINPALALIGMFGGLVFLGPIGLIIGPLILAYLGIFIELYRTGKIKAFK